MLATLTEFTARSLALNYQSHLASWPERIILTGGGAANPAWTAIRQRKLGVDFLPVLSDEAAAGTARLALKGASQAGLL